ncbi:hypothetical protein CHARACLAT_024968 [Characodon lateralis]|uniref:Uncharacterized protein n=1 Tax=Characodon lateralis TaxID=208331 RepID=A0ABU7D160_9TELE|nr:hypothetical protein [Characodon lateralis]
MHFPGLDIYSTKQWSMEKYISSLFRSLKVVSIIQVHCHLQSIHPSICLSFSHLPLPKSICPPSVIYTSFYPSGPRRKPSKQCSSTLSARLQGVLKPKVKFCLFCNFWVLK